MAEKTVSTPVDTKTMPAREKTRGEELYLSPPVDIYETKEGLIVVADMPGVEKDAVHVSVDNDILTIEGTVKCTEPGTLVTSEYKLVNFFRQFQVTEGLDRDRIAADLKHGVLKIQLPKAEVAKPKQIEVNVS